ncbi:hypothetical protein REPUB_Repub08aG0235700 [Reevesia pubescens]
MMDGIGEEGGGIRLSKRFSENNPGSSGEVDFKTKAGTAWSHSYLNQKPWHPLSPIPTNAASGSPSRPMPSACAVPTKLPVGMMKAVSFMYVRPPGYNAESAKAAEIADERKNNEHSNTSHDHSTDVPSTAMPPESLPGRDPITEEKKKPRPKDVFGPPLPTEKEFKILKNAPRYVSMVAFAILIRGVPGRVQPFGVEVCKEKCLRCGNYGHQNGNCECLVKDAIMPNEESRLKRDDPLTAIMSQMDPTEVGITSRGFLSGGNIPDLLTNICTKPKKRKSLKKSKHKRLSSPSSRDLDVSDQDGLSSTSDDGERKSKKEKKTKKKKKRRNYSESNTSDCSEFDRHQRKRGHKHPYSSEESDADRQYRSKESREKHSFKSEDSDSDQERWGKKSKSKHSYAPTEDFDRHHRKSKHKCEPYAAEDSDCGRHDRKKESTQKPYTSDDKDTDRHRRSRNSRQRHSYSSDDDDRLDTKSKDKRCYSCEDSDPGKHKRRKKTMQRLYISEDSDTVRCNSRSEKSRLKHPPCSSEDDADRHVKGEKSERKHTSSHRYEDSNSYAEHRSRHRHHH